MATLYFFGDGDWNNLNNWYMDEATTIPASSLPTSSDSVEIYTAINSNSGENEPTVVNLFVPNLASIINIEIAITVTGTATLNKAVLSTPGTINGNVTFNNNAYNAGVVNGNAIFTGINSFNTTGTINGNATFTSSSYTVNGSYISGNITGTVTFSSPTPVTLNFSSGSNFQQNSTNWIFTGGTATWNFNDSDLGTSLDQVIAIAKGNCNFINGGRCYGYVTGNATFNASIHYAGTISGNATYTQSAVYGVVGDTHVASNPIVIGTATFIKCPGSIEYGYFFNSIFDVFSAERYISNVSISYGASSFPNRPTILYEKGVNGSSILGIV